MRKFEPYPKRKRRPILKPEMSYAEYLKTQDWWDIRKKVLDRDGNRCRLCNRRNTPGDGLQVHHRVYNTKRGEENHKDLLTLCSDCHSLFHKYCTLPDQMTKSERKEERKEKRRKAKARKKKTYREPSVKKAKKRVKELRRLKADKEAKKTVDRAYERLAKPLLVKGHAEIIDQ